MDAGLAAVCGALAGAAATTGAAFATGWAQREAARITARVEHRKDRRQPRYEAYRQFIDAVTTLIDLPKTATSPVNEQVAEIKARIKEAWLTVSVLGPESAQKAASKVRRKATEYEITVLGVQGEGRIHSDNFWMHRTMPEDTIMQRNVMLAAITFEGHELDEILQEFITTAQTVLDDDGSRRIG
ncbi:hypothetical protein GCM10023084_07900 [Streptomyces lacrimifluminis]|uniref:Uncharacterized protein n=1 Tax=Streptomyces lacrimifluminis TaxID=1500077 RepID=A0A917KSY5_9ACTN|nr:hypothetical protein [Streptomyces lacrimifluminis]GGJ24959.1 hypothetical protein GCM10012282_21970 [Streptomyces lacrimifluminis]